MDQSPGLTATEGLDGALADRLRRFIQTRLPLVAVAAAGDIRLHLAGPRSGMSRIAGMAPQDAGPPYWAFLWGGGLALARYIQDHPGVVAGRRVLDLGAGCGIVGIAAARSGAREVLAADVAAGAIVASQLNAAANGVAVDTALGDLTAGEPPPVDLVLVGDLFYEAALAGRVVRFLDRCLAAGATVLVGDPWRPHLPRPRLTLLADYPGPDFGAGEGARAEANAVFAFGAEEREALYTDRAK